MGEEDKTDKSATAFENTEYNQAAAATKEEIGVPVNSEAATENSGAGEELEDYGYIELADEVISIVASLATCEVPGVIGMSTGFREGISKLLGKNNLAKGVRVKVNNKTVRVFVYVTVEYGICIPEIALKIQEKVKESIEQMTGYEVEYVDVHIEGVERRKKSDLEISFGNVDENVKDTIFNKE